LRAIAKDRQDLSADDPEVFADSRNQVRDQMQLRHEIATIEFCATQNYSRAAVLSALTIARHPFYDHDLRNCSIGA
jgi:hypothetical protein